MWTVAFMGLPPQKARSETEATHDVTTALGKAGFLWEIPEAWKNVYFPRI